MRRTTVSNGSGSTAKLAPNTARIPVIGKGPHIDYYPKATLLIRAEVCTALVAKAMVNSFAGIVKVRPCV